MPPEDSAEDTPTFGVGLTGHEHTAVEAESVEEATETAKAELDSGDFEIFKVTRVEDAETQETLWVEGDEH